MSELQDAVVGGNETGPVGAGERDTAVRPVAFRDKAASHAVGHASERGEAVAARGVHQRLAVRLPGRGGVQKGGYVCHRSEEHTSELQSLMRNSYAVFCLKK